jgi:hypothetical protein
MGRHQHLLGGNAATKCAGATQAVIFFDYRSFKTQLAGANRGHITTGSTADDRYIKLFIRQFCRFPLVRALIITIKDRAL